MEDKILIDTSILVNAYFLLNKKNNENAVKVIEKYANKEYSYITLQTIIEYINICKNKFKLSKKEIERQVNEIKTLFKIINYSEKSLLGAIDLCYSKKVLFFDALLVQTMIDNNVNLICTEDKVVFKKIKGLKTINPFK